MMKRFLLALLFVGAWIGVQQQAQAQAGDYRVQTIYIWNFTKYIQWPANYQEGDFVIGVLGNSPIIPQLRGLANSKKVVGDQRMVVKQYRTPANVDKCHILFIPNAESKHLAEVKENLKNSATLIVTEKNGLALQGSIINFILMGGKWRFELNLSEVDKAGLKVSNQLTRVAVVVN
jgi:hypothetical protein